MSNLRGNLLAAAVAAVFSLVACQPAERPAFATLAIAEHQVHAELAITSESQEQGLKGRAPLAEDAGMLFVLAKPTDVCMWMKDTPAALSVAFLDAEGRILNIEDMEPNSEAQHCAIKPAAYALEVRRGWFAARQITPGKQAIGLPRARA